MSYDLDTAPLLLCRTGWMTLYDGDVGTWSGTHGHPLRSQEAGEAWNFARTRGGHVYGYVQNGHSRALNVTRLGAHREADRAEGVTVVWCSRHPENNQLVIHGWYENAVASRAQYKRPDGKGFGRWVVDVYFSAAAEDAHLLPTELRRHAIPSHQPGTMGRTDVLYVDEINAPLAADVRRYLREARADTRGPAPAPGTPPDQRGWRGGETERHLALKLYVRDTPACLGVGLTRRGREEYVLPSLDGVDVVFETRGRTVAVEVKPLGCGEKEHERGLYQCVKYRALIEAEAADAGRAITCMPILVTEDALSLKHQATAKRFDILHRQISVPSART